MKFATFITYELKICVLQGYSTPNFEKKNKENVLKHDIIQIHAQA